MPARRFPALPDGFLPSISRQIREIFERFTPLVEPLSLDEAFLDVTGSEGLFGPSAEIGQQIKRVIRSELRLVASVGVAPNKFLAKIASDLEKPDGFVVVEPDRIQEFLDPLPSSVCGELAKSPRRHCTRWGFARSVSCGNARRLAEREVRCLGRASVATGSRHGRPPCRAGSRAKSISHETTFAADISDGEVLRAWLLELTEQVARRLRRHQIRGRTVQLKLRFSDFSTITRAQTLPEATHVTQEIWQAAAELLDSALRQANQPIRLLGLGVSGFEEAGERQRSLFSEVQHEKQRTLDEVQIESKISTVPTHFDVERPCHETVL